MKITNKQSIWVTDLQNHYADILAYFYYDKSYGKLTKQQIHNILKNWVDVMSIELEKRTIPGEFERQYKLRMLITPVSEDSKRGCVRYYGK